MAKASEIKTGNILRVNQAWKDFDLDTESKNGFIGIQEGTNYFEAIENNYLVLEGSLNIEKVKAAN